MSVWNMLESMGASASSSGHEHGRIRQLSVQPLCPDEQVRLKEEPSQVHVSPRIVD